MTEKLILFDIDGTLLYTGGAGKIAFEKAFEDFFQIPGCWGSVSSSGKSDHDLFREITKKALGYLPEDDIINKLLDRYVEYFPQALKDSWNFRLMPAIPQTLEVLEQTPNIYLALETGNLEATSWLKLKHAKLEKYFQVGGFGSDCVERSEFMEVAITRAKEHHGIDFARKNIFVIGDAPQDTLAAKTCGLTAIAVASGKISSQELAKHNPDYLLDDLSNTEELLRIIG